MLLDTMILILGISGIIAIALAVLLEILNKLDIKHHMFSLLNLYGTATLLFYSIYNSVWLFVLLNGFLLVTSLYGTYIAFKK